MKPNDLAQWLRYEHSFIVFLIGKHQERLIVSIIQIHSHIRKANLKLAKGDQIELHIIFERERYLFREFRDFDTSEFYQNDLLVTKGVNKPFLQALSRSSPEISQLPEYIPVETETISSAVKRIQEDETDQVFDPKVKKDARERIAASIVRRRGQPRFRKELLNAFEGRCAITGCDVKETLEAAHIVPYKGDHTNTLANGLLLRGDVHTLFDLGLIAIDTTTMTVILGRTLANTEYRTLKGSELKAKPQVLQRVKEALDEHRTTYFFDPEDQD
ncbi:MAG TPA: HNH endonuclease [Blastocatellia bacterium]|nr:HNH endonuclease [Blastocatellia bacterium]